MSSSPSKTHRLSHSITVISLDVAPLVLPRLLGVADQVAIVNLLVSISTPMLPHGHQNTL